MASKRRQVGDRWERLACRYLEKRGLTPIGHNHASRRGEIDLIMTHGEELCFVEVRYRTHRRFGGAVESVDPHKCRRLIAAARDFLDRQPGYRLWPCRFDVVCVAGGTFPRVDWIQDAFRLDDW